MPLKAALKHLDETGDAEEKIGKGEENNKEKGDPTTSARRMEEAKRYRKKVREILQSYLERRRNIGSCSSAPGKRVLASYKYFI